MNQITKIKPAKDAPMADAPTAAKTGPDRKRLLTLLGGAVVAGVVVYSIYWVLVASHYVETDNAYVGAETALVTPLTTGPAKQVLAMETQVVKIGDPLVILDDADARIALAAAQAELGRAQRRVQGYYASDNALAGQIAARDADVAGADAKIASARSDLDRAQTEFNRRNALATSGAVSGDELTAATNGLAGAKAALAGAQALRAQAAANRIAAVGSREVNASLISGSNAVSNPEVAAAQAKLDAAQLALDRTVIRSPVTGVVARKSVQVGQQVTTGAPIMAIVPTASAYVDANFKEVQLKKVRPGQHVEVTADLYGDSVKYDGVVRGLAGGTGAAFSLIPAQNASGNWIKVVQRVPVRIMLDPAQVQAHPLRVGLSMKASIDVSK
jgi:membrane fusion protein (multidrug efflux system)